MDRPRLWPARGWLLPLGLLATCSFAAAEVAGCFNSLDDCPSTLYFGPGCIGAAGTTTGTGAGSTATGTGTGSGTSTGGTAGSSATGTGGSKPECMSASDCKITVPPGPCASRGGVVCKAGKCEVEFDAGPAPSQIYGNCQQNWCAADGGESSDADDMNVYDDGRACDKYTCSGGMLSMVMQSLGQACTMLGVPGYCLLNPDPTNAQLAICTQCADDSECNPGVTYCRGGKCVLMHCTDGVVDNGETGTDCGGLDCPPCKVGGKCTLQSDCYSQVCAAPDGGSPTCQKPTCSDGMQNEDETYIDCGGSCPPCKDTAPCLLPTDCISGVCQVPGSGPPARCAVPSCTDGVQNGSETGIDCGGDGGCPPCGP